MQACFYRCILFLTHFVSVQGFRSWPTCSRLQPEIQFRNMSLHFRNKSKLEMKFELLFRIPRTEYKLWTGSTGCISKQTYPNNLNYRWMVPIWNSTDDLTWISDRAVRGSRGAVARGFINGVLYRHNYRIRYQQSCKNSFLHQKLYQNFCFSKNFLKHVFRFRLKWNFPLIFIITESIKTHVSDVDLNLLTGVKS